jgi:hypothetical protein
VDLYDAVSNRYIARDKTGQTFFNLPADEAMQLVLVPHGGIETRQRRELLVNGVIVDYNATLLPDNLVRNPDVDTALSSDANHPAYWHYSTNAKWAADTALSPSHSLELIDNNAASSEEWRNYATAVPAGTNRSLELRWFWKHDIATGSEFHARLRLSNDDATSVDLTNPLLEYDFSVTGTSADFDMFDNIIGIPDGIRSFDLTFISGGTPSATGTIYVDDISASLVTSNSVAGDYNRDGIVDAADYTVWRSMSGQTGVGLAADGNSDGQVNHLDYDVWTANFGNTAGAGSSAQAARIPEPSTTLLVLIGVLVVGTMAMQRERA